MMQVDEPALREGLPLKQERWQSYLDWAVKSFRLATAVAKNHTQIVTHLCYSEFADILEVCISTSCCSDCRICLKPIFCPYCCVYSTHHPAGKYNDLYCVILIDVLPVSSIGSRRWPTLSWFQQRPGGFLSIPRMKAANG